MGSFFVVVIVALIGWFAWRGARKRYEEAQAALRRRRDDDTKAVTLEKDPKTGVYRPRE